MTNETDNKIFIQRYQTPCGEMILGSYGDSLCMCNWVNEKHPGRIDRRLLSTLKAHYVEAPSAITDEARRQLDEYFSHTRKVFDIRLLLTGTEFQKRVWQELTQIPYGQTVSYKKLAENIGHKNAVRAVANANGANAISIFVPCHRVIGSDKKLTGYGGGTEAKLYLLKLEQALTSGDE